MDDDVIYEGLSFESLDKPEFIEQIPYSPYHSQPGLPDIRGWNMTGLIEITPEFLAELQAGKKFIAGLNGDEYGVVIVWQKKRE